MSEKQTHIAVLTGDIIGSTQMSPGDLERAFEALSDCAETMADWHGESLYFTRQRGDGWQVRLARPELALRTALAFRAALRCEGKEFSTYIAAAEGMAKPISTDADLNAASDPVFIKSGHLLDGLKLDIYPSQQMAHRDTPILGAVFGLADYISQSWTPAQAAAVLAALHPNTDQSYSDIARALRKSRQAVRKALNGAGFDAVQLALEDIEKAHHD